MYTTILYTWCKMLHINTLWKNKETWITKKILKQKLSQIKWRNKKLNTRIAHGQKTESVFVVGESWLKTTKFNCLKVKPYYLSFFQLSAHLVAWTHWNMSHNPPLHANTYVFINNLDPLNQKQHSDPGS